MSYDKKCNLPPIRTKWYEYSFDKHDARRKHWQKPYLRCEYEKQSAHQSNIIASLSTCRIRWNMGRAARQIGKFWKFSRRRDATEKRQSRRSISFNEMRYIRRNTDPTILFIFTFFFRSHFLWLQQGISIDTNWWSEMNFSELKNRAHISLYWSVDFSSVEKKNHFLFRVFSFAILFLPSRILCVYFTFQNAGKENSTRSHARHSSCSFWT